MSPSVRRVEPPCPICASFPRSFWIPSHLVFLTVHRWRYRRGWRSWSHRSPFQDLLQGATASLLRSTLKADSLPRALSPPPVPRGGTHRPRVPHQRGSSHRLSVSLETEGEMKWWNLTLIHESLFPLSLLRQKNASLLYRSSPTSPCFLDDTQYQRRSSRTSARNERRVVRPRRLRRPSNLLHHRPILRDVFAVPQVFDWEDQASVAGEDEARLTDRSGLVVQKECDAHALAEARQDEPLVIGPDVAAIPASAINAR